MNSYRRARERAKMTRFQAAVESGVTPSQIQNIERGISAPKVDTAMKLARAYKVSLDVLTGFNPAA